MELYPIRLVDLSLRKTGWSLQEPSSNTMTPRVSGKRILYKYCTCYLNFLMFFTDSDLYQEAIKKIMYSSSRQQDVTQQLARSGMVVNSFFPWEMVVFSSQLLLMRWCMQWVWLFTEIYLTKYRKIVFRLSSWANQTRQRSAYHCLQTKCEAQNVAQFQKDRHKSIQHSRIFLWLLLCYALWTDFLC